jgi:hypothetical protein
MLGTGNGVSSAKTIELFRIDRKNGNSLFEQCLDNRSARHLDPSRFPTRSLRPQQILMAAEDCAGWGNTSQTVTRLPTASGTSVCSPKAWASAFTARQPVQCPGAIMASPKSRRAATVSGMIFSFEPVR